MVYNCWNLSFALFLVGGLDNTKFLMYLNMNIKNQSTTTSKRKVQHMSATYSGIINALTLKQLPNQIKNTLTPTTVVPLI